MQNTYRHLFLELGKYAAIAFVVVTGLVVGAAIASSPYNANSASRPEAISAQFSVRSPKLHICPANATISGWIHTDKPGMIEYEIVEKNGQKLGPFKISTRKNVHGGIANFTHELSILEETDRQYQLVVLGEKNKLPSQWERLSTTCKINNLQTQNRSAALTKDTKDSLSKGGLAKVVLQ